MATAIPDIEVLKKKQKSNDEVNWVTAIFMGLFHVGAIAALTPAEASHLYDKNFAHLFRKASHGAASIEPSS